MARRRLEGGFQFRGFDDSVCTYIRDILFSPMHTDSYFVEVNTPEI